MSASHWTATATARGFTTILAIVALLVGVWANVQQVSYVHCVGAQQQAGLARADVVCVHALLMERRGDEPGGVVLAGGLHGLGLGVNGQRERW